MSNMNDQLQQEAAQAVVWFKRPVPLWATALAFLVGCVVGRL